MKRKLTLIMCGLTLSMGAFAAQLTPEQALERLGQSGVRNTRSLDGGIRELVYTASTVSGEPAVYVFGKADNKGYLLLSADEVAVPMLGYADSGSFDVKNMPEQMKWWMAEYARQIEYARANNLPLYSPTRSGDDRKAVAPMIKTTWNQLAPYNDLVPSIDGVKCPTGCVATAMAQVMKYWNYPQQATGSGTITTPVQETMALGEEPFDWANMLDSYSGSYTDAQAHAVAYLMKACGYGSEMRYGRYSSGTISYTAGKALIENFGYNPDLQYCTRNYYSATDWENMIYNEVANGRPVLYGGQSTTVGHEFVCDGYASDGYFHFNWGWSGMSDGYFLLDALNPNALGTGGGEGGGYNYAQDALIGVQPTQEQVVAPNVVQFGALTAKTSGRNLELTLEGTQNYWFNVGLHEVNLSFGIALEPLDKEGETTYINVLSKKIEAPEVTSTANGSMMRFDGIPGQLSTQIPITIDDGRYKVTVVCAPAGTDAWTPVQTLPEYYNYVYLTNSGYTMKVENIENADITLDSAEMLSSLYYGCVVKMKITATNNSEKELTQGFYPELFFDGKEQMIADGIVLTIPANTSVTEEFVTTFRLVNGASAPTTQMTYQMAWYDPIRGNLYPGVETVTMKMVTGSPSLSVEGFEIAGVTPAPATLPEYGAVSLYTVEDEEAEFVLNFTNKRGFFGYPLYVAIFEPGNEVDLVSAQFQPLVTLDAKESAEVKAKVNLSQLQKEHAYLAMVFYEGTKDMVYIEACPVLYFTIAEGAGVNDIIGDDDAPVKYYNLQGIEVTNPEKGMLLIKRQGAKSSKVIF